MPAYTQIAAYLWYGLSTDTKPTGVALSTLCYETDTVKAYITRDGSTWIEAATNLLGGIPFMPDYTVSNDLAVPGADSAANVTLRDVIGNKTDTVAGNSIIALLKAIKAKTDTI